MIAVVELVEVGVGVPGLVEMKHFDRIAEGLLYRIDVVAETVIRRIGYDHQADLAVGLLGEFACCDLLLDRLGRELFLGYRTDDPQAVAGRHEIDRYSPGHDKGVQDRLVAVAVAQNQVVAADGPVPYDLVGGGGAAHDEKRLVRSEDSGGVALAFRYGTSMVQQRSKLADRHRDIGTQGILAEELVELQTHRALAKGDAAAVAGRVPGIAGLKCVVHERLEHRRGKTLQVELCCAHDGSRHEFG